MDIKFTIFQVMVTGKGINFGYLVEMVGQR